jgi:hypothetical protein
VAEPAANLARAELHELKPDFSAELSGGKTVKVQFNPETLKVSFANQLVQPSSGGDQRGTPARQFVGAGTTKLALQLWFDVTALPPDQQAVKDVRKLTKDVAYFITPKKDEKGGKDPKFVPPAVRFLWGSFQFDGMLDSMEESLEFFSPDGRPLRANVSLALSQQKITEYAFGKVDAAGGPGGPGGGTPSTPGTKPLTPASQGSTVQGLAERQGVGGDWQAIARANGIENPRMLATGRLLDMNVPTPKL